MQISRTGEMAQLVECLLCMRQDLTLSPSTHIKARWSGACNDSAEKVGARRPRAFPFRQSSRSVSSGFSERPCLKK